MATGDVYQVVDTQTLAGQKCLNVYFYEMTTESDDANGATGVAQAFIDTLLPAICAVQVNDLTHISVKATNLFDDTDAHEELISEPGTLGGSWDTVFTAYGFRLVGDNAAVRAGAKRIAGVRDDEVEQDVVVGPTTLTALSALATDFAAFITYGTLSDGILVPVIIKRLLVGTEYVLPDNLLDAVISVVTDALFNTFITSQVSRKIGRGE